MDEHSKRSGGGRPVERNEAAGLRVTPAGDGRTDGWSTGVTGNHVFLINHFAHRDPRSCLLIIQKRKITTVHAPDSEDGRIRSPVRFAFI